MLSLKLHFHRFSNMLFLLIIFSFSSSSAKAQSCISGPDIVCLGEEALYGFSNNMDYDEVLIDAFTVVNNIQINAIKSDVTDDSFTILFLEPGNAEVVVRFLKDGVIIDVCNQNVFVFGDEPISGLGKLSEIVGDRSSCGNLDLLIRTFIVCEDCPYYWTLDGEEYLLEEFVTTIANTKFIDATISLSEVGSYELCQHILSPDSACVVTDCITLDIVELDDEPQFEIDDAVQVNYCLGTQLQFINNTEPSFDQVTYIFSVTHDTLTWTYSTHDLDFQFTLPGDYEISLYYYLNENKECTSPIVSSIVNISDTPVLQISCTDISCGQESYTYGIAQECDNVSWNIDENLGTIISQNTTSIEIVWNEVTEYTETIITGILSGCDEDVCNIVQRKIELFPASINIEGPQYLCSQGEQWYETTYVPEANYTWEIVIIDNIQGLDPEITKIEDGKARIDFKSFVGIIDLVGTISDEARSCSATETIRIYSYIIQADDNICPSELFTANVIPPVDAEVVWTVRNAEIDFESTTTQDGDATLLLFDFPAGGTYYLSLEVPEQDFQCQEPIPFNIFDVPEINLSGPLSICPGDTVMYTLENLALNDQIEWTVWINGTPTEYSDQTITVIWPEDGFGFQIIVDRMTEVSPGKFCDTESQTFFIEYIDEINFQILGAEVVCYDAPSNYTAIGSAIGLYEWQIIPENMGTIVEGDSTENITVQWHYSPTIKNATLRLETEICDSLHIAEFEVEFSDFVPEIVFPDTICQNTNVTISMPDLSSFRKLDYYVDGELQIIQNATNMYNVFISEAGTTDIRIVIERPNECPGIVDTSFQIFANPTPVFSFMTDTILAQCPKEDFMDVVLSTDLQNSEFYYLWTYRGDTIKEGFGMEDLYFQVITKEMIDSSGSVALTITSDQGCENRQTRNLDYDCDGMGDVCVCIDSPVGEIVSVTPLECNKIAVEGSLDFSTVINPFWLLSGPDSFTIIEILTPEDLVIDTFITNQFAFGFNVSLAAQCLGEDGAICNVTIGEESVPLFNPKIESSFTCNTDLTYDVELTELRVINPPNFSEFILYWEVDGMNYEGDYLTLENRTPGEEIAVFLNQCSPDGSYCCSISQSIRVPDLFDPQIILPNGSCENDLWLFTIDIPEAEIVDILWDFNDNSGSTLYLTEKGFLDTLAHSIYVTVESDLGCIAQDTIIVNSATNELNGTIDFISDPCAKSTVLTYSENSSSEIIDYSWNIANAENSPIIEVEQSGIYEVTVTDNNGCTFATSSQYVTINESFVGGINYLEENCGAANVSISPNLLYTYEWFVNDELASNSSGIQITNPGNYDVQVISYDSTMTIACDSIAVELVVYPNPETPILASTIEYCHPFIEKLFATNYDSLVWSGNGFPIIHTPSIQVAQNGTYSATYTDENNCKATGGIIIENEVIDLSYLNDACILACREDLDSLSLSLPGNSSFFDSWTWETNDISGNIFIVQEGLGATDPLLITEDMYDFVILTTYIDECVYTSSTIPLDIENCTPTEEPIECIEVNPSNELATEILYDCDIDEDTGSMAYYYEGTLVMPENAILCSTDTLSAISSNGTFSPQFFNTVVIGDNQLLLTYGADITVADSTDFAMNGLIIQFDFCDDENEITHCYEFLLQSMICEEPIECIAIDANSASCGQAVYDCLLSEGNGGPKYYYEGSLTLPEDVFVCNEDSLYASMVNGDISITFYHFEPNSTTLHYGANIFIDDVADFKENDAVITFEFCDEEGEFSFCYDYLLPYRSCNEDFDCLTYFNGITAYDSGHVGLEYCFNLHSVIQENCELESYTIEATLWGDSDDKLIFNNALNQDFDTPICISIPVAIEDFNSGLYDCVEVIINGDCPGTMCSSFDCGMMSTFGLHSSNTVQSNTISSATPSIRSTNEKLLLESLESSIFEWSIYPNPVYQNLYIDFEGQRRSGTLSFLNIQGQIVQDIELKNTNIAIIDITELTSGIYIVKMSDRVEGTSHYMKVIVK